MPRIPNDEHDDPDEMPFVHTVQSAIGTDQDNLQHIGTAWIGGDFGGDPRGDYAFDLQGERASNDRVASGGYAIAFGSNNKASGYQSVALGNVCEAKGLSSVALGEMCSAGDQLAVALGSYADAPGDSSLAVGCNAQAQTVCAIALGTQCRADNPYSIAIGFEAAARVNFGLNLGATILVKRSDPRPLDPSLWFGYYGGAEVVVFGPLIDLTAAGDITLVVPPGARFWLNEVGLVLTSVAGLVTPPTVRYGVQGALAKHVAPTPLTVTNAGQREFFTPAARQDGEITASFGVTVGANAAQCLGRPYWQGLFVENED